MSKQKADWKLVRGTWISAKPVLPGVWQRKEGGHVVRARAKDALTGRQKDIWKVLPLADATTALRWLKDEQARVRAGDESTAHVKVRFGEFAQSVFEYKVKVGDIRSAKGRIKWRDNLKRLISETKGKTSQKSIAGLGDFYLDKLRASHIEKWKEGLAELVMAGDYAPTTINCWLSTLRVICKAAKRQYGLAHLATEGVDNLDTSEHVVYTPEQPNALLAEEVGLFLAKVRELYPSHFAMVYLGMITGLRPSSLRPLRRRGSEADIVWEECRLYVRRSHSRGQEVMNTTKQKRRYSIDLPEEAIEVLRWHVDTQLRTPEQQESDLLFPSLTGGFRSSIVLCKPFGRVTQALGLRKKVTPRALRRTFNDLARDAKIEGVVTRSISGHLTEAMQEHYSTVNRREQRAALTRVIQLCGVHPGEALNEGSTGEDGGEGGRESGEDRASAG